MAYQKRAQEKFLAPVFMERSPKKIVLRFRAENAVFFRDIRTGRKKVETRAATVRYRNITAGDRIEFVCGEEGFSRTVKSATIFKDFKGLLKKYHMTDITPGIKSLEEFKHAYYGYPGYREKLKKFGIIALTFKKK